MNKIIAVVCFQSDGGIGYQNKLLFAPGELPGDMKRFKELTIGTNVIMGRKTWDSLDRFRPLPNRRNIVITSKPSQLVDSTKASNVMNDPYNAVARCKQIWKTETVSIAGGAEIYKLLFPLCDEIYATEVVANRPADAFVTIPKNFHETSRERKENKDGLTYYFVKYEKIVNPEITDGDGS
jgi:dihydrofolate reductase